MKNREVTALPQREHAKRLGISQRQLRRRIVTFGLIPVGVEGGQPLYSTEEIVAMESARKERELARFTPQGSSILTVKEARKRASKGARR